MTETEATNGDEIGGRLRHQASDASMRSGATDDSAASSQSDDANAQAVSVTVRDEDGNDVSNALPPRKPRRHPTDPTLAPSKSRYRHHRSRMHSNLSDRSGQSSRSPKKERKSDDSLDGKAKEGTDAETRSRHALQSAITHMVSGGIKSKFNELLACVAEEHERALAQAISALIAENVQLAGQLRQAQQCLQNSNIALPPKSQIFPSDRRASNISRRTSVDERCARRSSVDERSARRTSLASIESCSFSERTSADAQDDNSSVHSNVSRAKTLPSLLTSKRECFSEKSETDQNQPEEDGLVLGPLGNQEQDAISPKLVKKRNSLLEVPARRKSSVFSQHCSTRNSIALALQQPMQQDLPSRVDSVSSTSQDTPPSASSANVVAPASPVLNVAYAKRDSVRSLTTDGSRKSMDLSAPGSRRNSFKHVTMGCTRELPNLREDRTAAWRDILRSRSCQDDGYVSEVTNCGGGDDSLKILQCWRAIPLRSTIRHSSDLGTSSRAFRLRLEESEGSMDHSVSLAQRLVTQLVIRPGSQKQVVWDIFGMGFMIYEVVTIPLQIFDFSTDTITTAISLVSSIFWTLDIPVTFLTGFNFEGVAELRLEQIARHYARTWLGFDVVVILVDWSIHVFDAIAPDSGHWLSGRSLSALRLLRLARFVKLRRVVNDMTERVRSEFTLVMIGVARVIISIMLLNHIIACTWYGIGVLYDEGDGQNTWVRANNLSDKGLGYRYFTALHWSLTQFTPASMEIMPTNTLERVFAVLVLLFAMLTFSSLVSSITNAMTQLRNLNSEKLEQMSMLRRYLGENKVSTLIMGRIWGCLDRVVDKSKRRLHQKDVTILSMLPSRLKGDLLEEVYAPILAVHPFWKQFAQALPLESKRTCQNAIEEASITIGHEVFNTGEAATHMFFILSGMLTYKLESTASCQPAVIVTTGSWTSEAALWIDWKHVGQLVSTTHGEVLTISPTSFCAAVVDAREPLKYAALFAEYFKENPCKLTDTWTDYDIIQELATKAFTEEMVESQRSAHCPQTLSEAMMGVVPHWQGMSGRRSSVARLWNAFTPFTKLWQPDECLEESLASSQVSGTSCDSSRASSPSNSGSHSQIEETPYLSVPEGSPVLKQRFSVSVSESVKDRQAEKDHELNGHSAPSSISSPKESQTLSMSLSMASPKISPKASLNSVAARRAWN